MDKKIRTMVVDDSPIIRRAIIQAMDEVDDIEVVAVANNGEEAIEKYLKFKPDVVTMDVIMPKMDGLSALKILTREYRVPVIMLSGVTSEGAGITIRALDLGAVDFITKPRKGSMLLNFQLLKDELSSKIRVASKIDMDTHLDISTRIDTSAGHNGKSARDESRKTIKGYSSDEFLRLSEKKVVVIGASTGGPKALEFILTKIGKGFPVGIIVAQHMPGFFTQLFAKRLNSVTPLNVVEAKDGDIIEEGKVLIAPGEFNIKINKTFLVPQVKLDGIEEDFTRTTPSIDTLFYSAAASFGNKTVGVILTGMGIDGSKGMKAIKIMGGSTIAQDEKTSLVFGMPKSAINSGVVDSVLSLYQMPAMINDMVRNGN